MDGSNIEHSDSDSGESWILLEQERSQTYTDGALNICHMNDRDTDKQADEDTDGISIISDSEPESVTPSDMSSNVFFLEQENHPTEQAKKFIPTDPLLSNNEKTFESIDGDDCFLGSNHKLKTYVHRRNKRLSTVLNVIVLGSVITAAGVAIGHMWGVRDDCSMHTTPSINKILSNLYKLQEENSYLRNIIKELTLNVNNIQAQKTDPDKYLNKQHRCKKVFEEPLANRDVNKHTKCVDNQNDHLELLIEKHLKVPNYEREFLQDINKLKGIYKENKSWLDDEVIKRFKNEKSLTKRIRNKRNLNSMEANQQNHKDESEHIDNLTQVRPSPDIFPINGKQEKNKISYADTLKLHTQEHGKLELEQIRTDNIESKTNALNLRKKIPKIHYDAVSENSLSENDVKKDNRYTKSKQKFENKKEDRINVHRKQKRKNKYEQWEMKGGYLKDYDDFSIVSFQVNENAPMDSNKIKDLNSYDKIQIPEEVKLQNNKPKKPTFKCDKNGKNCKDGELNWYDKRANLRAEARKKIEKEFFGETTPNKAGWYFRRMQRREQCRAKGENSTYRKLSKRNKNYKIKH